jgi:hypothetical protein
MSLFLQCHNSRKAEEPNRSVLICPCYCAVWYLFHLPPRFETLLCDIITILIVNLKWFGSIPEEEEGLQRSGELVRLLLVVACCLLSVGCHSGVLEAISDIA